MPGIRDIFESFCTMLQAAGTAVSGMRPGGKKKEKKPQTFRGGGRGTVDLNNYDPKDANKAAQRGGNTAALKNMDLTSGLKAKLDKLKKKEPPRLAGRGNSNFKEKKVGVTPPQRLKRI